MDGFSIQAKVQRGYSIAARALGTPYRQYRPQPGLAALDASGMVGTLKASFDANDYNYTQPLRQGDEHRWSTSENTIACASASWNTFALTCVAIRLAN